MEQETKIRFCFGWDF